MDKIAKEAHLWARDGLDWYVEPERCTAQLLSAERFVGNILDPCCGGGNIVRTLRAAGCEAFGSDVVDRTGAAPWFLGVRDFLTDIAPTADNIVMNPPFFGGKGAEAFIRCALAHVPGKVCAFVDRRFCTGKGRAAGLYRQHRPARVYEITPRPSCPPGVYLEAGNKAGGGTADYCWIVWDNAAPTGRTELDWLT